MPIVAGDIDYHISGGAANSNQNASLGGARSSTLMGNVFDNVASGEASAGDVEYRCVYVLNSHPTLTLQNAKIWIQSQTPSGDTAVDIGLGTSAVGTGNEQTVADEQTAPTGVTFSAPANEGAALTIGDIPPGSHKAIWIRRTVSAGAAAYTGDGFTLRVKGDTLA